MLRCVCCFFFFFQAEDGIRDKLVTGVQTCALPIYVRPERVSAQVHVAPGAAKVPPALVRSRDHRSQRGIGPEGERQRARRRRIRAPDLDERRSAKPAAHRPEQLMARPGAPGEAHAGAQPSKDVEPAYTRIMQDLERVADAAIAYCTTRCLR